MSAQKTILLKDIMIKDVASVTTDVSVLEAAEIMIKNGYTGMPVVDKNRKVIGIVTEYDFLTKGTAIHLPTFIKLFGDFPAFESEKIDGKKTLKDALAFTVKDIMNSEPLLLHDDDTFREAVHAFGEHHKVNPIPIVDKKGVLAGIVSRFDVIKFYATILSKANRDK